jgi:GNAT superfamily N-acetyltransferase
VNIVIDEKFQGKGYGLVLLKEFIKTARQKNFARVVGHFRHNGSAHLMNKLGGREIRIEKDWLGTREDYSFCELVL